MHGILLYFSLCAIFSLTNSQTELFMRLLANLGMPDHTYEKNWSKYFPFLTVSNHAKQFATE